MAKDAKAYLRRLRISPRKVRLVADMIRSMPLQESKLRLNFLSKRSSLPILKLVKSAESNAKNNLKMNTDNLYIKEIRVDEGPTLKRYMPRAKGRATIIRKRTSHVSLTLAEKNKK